MIVVCVQSWEWFIHQGPDIPVTPVQQKDNNDAHLTLLFPDPEGRLQSNREHKSLATLQDGRFSASLGRCWANIWRITTCLHILHKQKLQCEDYYWF